MKITYVPKNFRAKSLDLIEKANSIISKYQEAGYDLTLRQLYYQMVARNFIPNDERSYKNFGSLISDARMGGLVDWEAIVDITRVTQERPHWTSPEEVIYSAYVSYNIDQWEGQIFRPRVWIEKEALVGIISRTCRELDVPYLACRGYMSQSSMWTDSREAMRQEEEGQRPIIIHLGDHDPSGLDMTRDIDDRMEIFGAEYHVNRIALNYSQVEDLNLPPNPTKLSDSRAADYISNHGRSSWELDALNPEHINRIIRETIMELIDPEPWEERQAILEHHKNVLRCMSDNYDAIESYIEDEGLT